MQDRLLHELAWDAVTSHPLSGVKKQGRELRLFSKQAHVLSNAIASARPGAGRPNSLAVTRASAQS